jgi:acetoin utilization deacetylase AcuC-like enzyme
VGSSPLWLRHDASLRHDIPGHPERPERIVALESELDRHDWFGFARVEAPPATRALLHAVHPEEYVAFIEDLCASGGGMIDMDTAAVGPTYEAALHAAGGAAALVDALLGGEAPTGFAALRPPGHHAEPARAMGFCFFNNVAVAARRATAAHGCERVLILDWDVHHGNGTNDIFHAADDVLFVSIHEWPLYPGTGPASDLGSGAGEGYTVNLPVPSGSGDETYRSLVDHVACPLIAAWEPQLVLVSAGFDAHRLDPLADCRVSAEGYAAMTASLRGACRAVGAPLGLVLEGGYSLEALTSSVAALAPVLAGEAVVGVDPVAVHPLAERAADRLARWWPALGQPGSTRGAPPRSTATRHPR